MKLKRGSTSVRRLIFIADSSSTTGAGLASLVYNSAGLVAYYFAGDLSNEVQITLATATLGTFASGGFIAVDNTNMPGWYEIGIPDAALDGGNEVCIQLRGATNMVPVNIYIELDAVDYQSATNFGLSKFADIETDTQDIQSRIPAALTADGNIKSDTLRVAGTAQTARDLGANIDVATSTRMASYTQPTNFLATTFPTTTVASSTEVTAIQNNTRTVIVVPTVIERLDSGTDTYLIHIYLYDEVGNMEAPDSAPTVALTNSAGTDRSSRLGSTTGTLVGTGHYKWVYTNTSTDTLEQLLWEFSVVEGGATRLFGRDTLLVDTTAVDFTAADRTTLQATATAAALTVVGNNVLSVLADTNELQTDLTDGGRLDLLLDAIFADTDSLDTTKLTTARAAVLTDWIDGGRLDLILDAILADTDSLDTTKITTARAAVLADWIDGGRLDLILDIIAADTTTDIPATIEVLRKLLRADHYIDTSVTPWALVYMQEGTGGIGVGTELFRKRLFSTAGVNLTSTDTVVGQSKV